MLNQQLATLILLLVMLIIYSIALRFTHTENQKANTFTVLFVITLIIIVIMGQYYNTCHDPNDQCAIDHIDDQMTGMN